MALPTTGPLSFLDIQGEYGGNFPITMTEYYGENNIPNSGTISVQDFRGQSAQFNISQTFRSTQDAFATNSGQAIARITFNDSGQVFTTGTNDNLQVTNWINPTSDSSESNFQVFATRTNTLGTFGNFNSWINISGDPSFGIESNNGQGFRLSDFTFKIRDGSDTSNTTSERTIQMSASSETNL